MLCTSTTISGDSISLWLQFGPFSASLLFLSTFGQEEGKNEEQETILHFFVQEQFFCDATRLESVSSFFVEEKRDNSSLEIAASDMTYQTSLSLLLLTSLSLTTLLVLTL